MRSYFEKRPMLVRYFAARTRDDAMAEDVVQELYIKIMALDPDYRVDNETAFLFRAGRNILLNQIRGKSRSDRREADWLESRSAGLGRDAAVDAPSAEEQLSARQQLQQVYKAVADLPEPTQKIFRLYRFDGLNQADVAERLQISKSSVEKHLSKAMKILLACFGA